MRNLKVYGIIIFLVLGCKSKLKTVSSGMPKAKFKMAFGSCNKHTLENTLWDDVLLTSPDIWVWGGDNVYADTDNMDTLRSFYNAQNSIQGYEKLRKRIPIIGCWDDHDYGMNDGGVEFHAKAASQQEFLNFMGVAADSPRRNRQGTYASHDYGKVKVLVLDTRYFRTAVTQDTETKKRLKPNAYGEGTVLGESQWKWLEQELYTSKADFNILVSSIQFLSNEHGFECWGNFPHEVDRLKRLLVDSKANNVIVLSGDRHISEFSKTKVEGLAYPLIDFTSSGLTHAYSKFTSEPNPYRVGEVIKTESFGELEFDFDSKKVTFKMRGDKGAVLGELQQVYE